MRRGLGWRGQPLACSASNSVPWASNAPDNSTRCFSASARSVSQAACATFKDSFASSWVLAHNAATAVLAACCMRFDVHAGTSNDGPAVVDRQLADVGLIA
jgi:hypothetical protein